MTCYLNGKGVLAMNCEKCGRETFLPFKCQYCGGYFCSEHRLPENHECPRIEQARIPRQEAQPFTVQKQKPYEYTVTFTPVDRRMRFSPKEAKHLLAGALIVAAVGASTAIFEFQNDYTTLALFTLILTASFFIHELAHKIVAQKQGFWAEFRLTLIGAIITLISILPTPFKIISPGAVMISGFPDQKKLGKTSIAGPATNIVLSAAFLAAALTLTQYGFLLLFGAAFNAWIALFNLIPLGILDGFKVFAWSKRIWVLAFALSIALTVVSFKMLLY
jgi:Zn-dependent protease